MYVTLLEEFHSFLHAVRAAERILEEECEKRWARKGSQLR